MSKYDSMFDAIQNNNYQTTKKKKKSYEEQFDDIQNNSYEMIAPIKSNQQQEEEKFSIGNEILKRLPGYSQYYYGKKAIEKIKGINPEDIVNTTPFDDGYQPWDVTKTAAGTILNGATAFTKGVMGIGDSAAKLVAGGAAQVFDWAGNEEFANALRKAISDKSPEAVANKRKYTPYGWVEQLNENTDDYSILGEAPQQALEGAGYYAGMTALQEVGVPWYLTAAASSMGNELGEAYSHDAEDWEAWASAINSAAWEVVSEKLAGGVKLPGTGKTTEALFGSAVDQIKNKTLKALVGFGINMAGEGAEEVISGITSEMGRRLTYMRDDEKSLIENALNGATDYMSQQALDDFIMGAVVSGITMGVNPQTYRNAKAGRNLVTGYTSNEQRVLDKVTDDRIAEAQKNSKKPLTKKQLNQISSEVKADFESGNIGTKNIENVLGYGEVYLQLKNQTEDSIGRELTPEEDRAVLQEATEIYNESIKDDAIIQQNYYEDSLRSQVFEANLEDYDEELRETIQKAIDSGILNNSTKTHQFVEFLSNLARDKGVTFDFTNNEALANSGIGINGAQVNGYVNANGDITLNIESGKSLNSVVGHELTHVLEGSDLYNALKDSIKEYATTIGEYQDRYDKLAELYKDVKNANIEKELTADLVGDYLFTNQEFINHLTSNRNLFEKIYDEIKYLVKQALPGSKEEKQLRKVQKMFEQAYKDNSVKLAEQQNNVTPHIKYSIEKYESAKNNIDRNTLLDVASTLNITHKDGVKVINDEKMSKAAGNNKNPKIINIDKLIEDTDLFDGLKNAQKGAIELYAPKSGDYTLVNNKDTKTDIELGKSGIKKTFGKVDSSSEVKSNTYSILDDILEEGIYYQTTQNKDDATTLYHHFLTPVKAYNTDGNAFVRSVVKEFLDREDLYNKFYYHQLEYLDNEKEVSPPAALQSSENQDFENTSYENNIAPIKEDVKLSLSTSLEENDINITTDINNEFFKEHESDFDKNNGKSYILYDNYGNKIEQTTNVYKLEKGNNLAKLSTTLEQNVDDNYGKLYIEELYVKNKGEGFGTEIINSLKQYAKENNLDLYTMKELGNPKTQKFWNSVTEQDFGLDKTSRQLYSYYQPGYNISKTDSNGNKLSYQQRQYFKDSKVVDENRDLQVVYHQTNNEFTEFKNGYSMRGFKNANFFTNQEPKQVLKHMMKGYVNITNPLYLENTSIQQNIVDNAIANGYDGIINQNVQGIEGKNEIVTFNSNQFKNIDNTNPTDNPDIRYSLSTDSTGKELSQQQQEYFKDSKVRDNEGRLLEVYHGTRSDFTIFDINKSGASSKQAKVGFWFTENKQGAENFGNSVWYGNNEKAKAMEVYLNITNPKIYETIDFSNEKQTLDDKIKPLYEKEKQIRDKYGWGTFTTSDGEYFYRYYNMLNSKYSNYTDDEMLNYIESSGVTKDAKAYLQELKDYQKLENDIKELEKEKSNYRYNDSYERFRTDIYKYANMSAEDANIDGIGMAIANENEVMQQYINDLKNQGYDGIIIKGTNYDTETLGKENNQYVAFYPNQIKNIDNLKPTEDADIRYSLTQDSKGRELTTQQQEYFKDETPELLDNEGNLLVMYHGTESNVGLPEDERFTIFDRDRAGNHGSYYGSGFYFTPHLETAQDYAKSKGDVYEVYLKMTNPYKPTADTINEDGTVTFAPNFYEDFENRFKDQLPQYWYDENTNKGRVVRNILQDNGYDGIINGDTYVVFEPNQIKNVDNLNPTDNEDIRYSLSDSQDERISKLEKEYNDLDFTREVTFEERDALRNDLNKLIRSDEYKNAETKFKEMIREGSMTPDEISQTPEYTLMEQEQNIRNKLREYDEDIKVMTEDMTRISEMIENEQKEHRTPQDSIKQAKETMGTTNDYREAGYLLQDGDMLDFSGRYEGSNTYGRRAKDHREINEFGYDMNEFIRLGNIRMKPEGNGFEMAIEPTKEQYSKLYDYIDYLKEQEGMYPAENSYIDVDIERPDSSQYDTIEYKMKTPTSKIINDIKEYWRTGEFPKQSEFSQFYSLSRNDEDIAPTGNYNVYGSDIALQDELAPVKDEFIKKDILDLIHQEVARKGGKKVELVKPVIAKEKTPARTTFDTLIESFVNENVELDNMSRESGNKMIKIAGDMLNNAYSEAQYDITAAQTDNYGNEIGKSVQQLFELAKKEGLEAAFNDYLINYSNIDRWARGKGSQTPLDVSERLVANYEEKYPQFKEWAQDVWKYAENVRNNWLEAGMISQNMYKVLSEAYPHYVPYISDTNNFDATMDKMTELKARPIKKAKGGAAELFPVEEALTRYTYSQKKAYRQNELYKQIYNTLQTNPGQRGAEVGEDYFNGTEPNLYRDDSGNYLTAVIDGEERKVQISDDLYKSLSHTFNNQVKDLENRLSTVLKPLQWASNIRRKLLTTWNPVFLVKNVVKDLQDGVLNSKHTTGMLKNYAPGIVELFTNSTPEAKQFKALYGTDALRGQYNDENLYKPKEGNKNNGFLKGLVNANEIMELAPRYAEFKASLQAGESLEEAMYNAREVTTNFARGGVITKALNRNGFTFLNASVQGFDKFIRNFSGENGARGIANSLLKAAIFAVAPAVFNELAFGAGDDKDEDYDALPDYIKDNYYLIKMGDGTFVRIPKGRMLSVFGSAARRTIELAEGEEDAFEGYLSNVNNQIGVSNPEENNVFSPLIQAFGSENGTSWYGGDIVPTRLQDKPAAEQYDASTDKMSIWLGEHTGISPYKINYVLDQYSGGIGDIALPMITDEATSNGNVLAPVVDQFVVDSTTDNKYVSDFYSKNDELKVKANSSKATDDDLLRNQFSYEISKELGQLYAERREIQSNNSLTKAQKYEKSQAIKKQINEIAKFGLDNTDNISRTGNYADVGDRAYYKNAKGKWTAADQKDITATESMGLTNREKDAYYTVKNEMYNIDQTYDAKLKGASDEQKTKLNAQKKVDIINSIKNTNLPDNAKATLYDKKYGSTETLNAVIDCKIDFDSYLDLQAQNFTADKDINGKTINGSKKRKIYSYINQLDMPYEQKIMLAKLEYKSDDTYNREIINYLNNDKSINYQTMVEILEAMGFKIDSNGNISWE